MAPIKRKVWALAQLFRVKPVLSWGLAAFVLGAGVSYGRVGADLDYANGLLALLAVALAQGFVSHGLNDAYDWVTGTDKESIGKGTGGSRVIPQGKMTVPGTVAAASVALLAVVGIGWYFYLQFGTAVALLMAVAIWSPVAYSLPPLKLGYRPFNELLVVLPAIVAVTVGADLVLAGSWSPMALMVGMVHAMFCISWFIVSRVPDYTPDKRVGKKTSVVYVGRGNAALLSSGYLALGMAVAFHLFAEGHVTFAVTGLAWALMMVSLSGMDPYDAESASDTRLRNMHITTGHALAVAIGLAALGV